MTRVAAVDCGTNSVRLLVADVEAAGGVLTELDRRLTIVRLGEGVDRTGLLAPVAVERTLAVLAEYRRIAARHRVERIRMVATSAIRDARNRADFVDGVCATLGVPPEVVTGEEEARLSYVGATRELPGAEPPAPRLVVDIGGGSTEFVLGDGTARAAESVDIGCVRLTERHLRADPPTGEQVEAAVRDIDAALDAVARTVPLAAAASLIGLAGTVTTIAGMHLGLDHYDPARIHHSRLPAAAVRDITAGLLVSGHAERAAIGVMHPGRVDVIAAGALILDRVVARTAVPEVVVSEHDILDGIAWSIA